MPIEGDVNMRTGVVIASSVALVILGIFLLSTPPVLASHTLSGTITINGHIHPPGEGTPVGGFTISVSGSGENNGVISGILYATVTDATGHFSTLNGQVLKGRWKVESGTDDKISMMIYDDGYTVKINLMGFVNGTNLPFEGIASTPSQSYIHLLGNGSVFLP